MTSTDVKISVVTVNYQHCHGLQRTLQSVEAQTWRSTESVIVDGASSDGSAEIMSSFRPAFEVRAISEPDDGIYDAMNKGISLASGDLVIFMNSGDVFSTPSVLTRVAEAYALGEGWRWGYGCGRVMTDQGPRAVLSFVPFRLDRLALGLATVPHQAVVMELSLLRELGGFSLSTGLSADQELLLRAGLKSEPRLWAEFFVDFEGGGVGSTRKPLAYPHEMRVLRRRLGLPVGGSWTADSVLTAGVLASRVALDWQSRIRSRLSGPETFTPS